MLTNIAERCGKIAKVIASLPVHVYRMIVSPLLPPSCRHLPTCSAYTLEAIEVHGAAKGTWLGAKRLMRCHPIKRLGGTSGFDPVPTKENTDHTAACGRDHGHG